ncbi:MAG: MBL fold metallo-hydrolase [candidate division WOR-3 bacterium]
MRISFLGACKTVTGSMHLVEAGGLRVLVDAGMFQGEDEFLNWADFPFEPESLDFVIITHAHLDHLGLLPKLVKEGFRGKVIAHKATLDLSGIMLEDSLKVQKEDLQTENRRRIRRGMPELEPLYDENDLRTAVGLFVRGIDYGREIGLGSGVSVVLHDAGHILGSAFVELNHEGKRVIFSGDIGNTNKPIIRDPSLPKKADAVVLESTYGGRTHEPIDETAKRFGEIISETFARGGNVILPSFALERAQDILYYLREMHERGSLPKGRYFLDSPLAIDSTEIFRKHPECYDQQAKELFMSGKDIFFFPGLCFTRTPDESKAINRINERALIIASGGMCAGGRIKHHLKHRLWNERNSIVFTGYQAKGTPGRYIADGAEEIEIYWEKVAVRAEVHILEGFSAHADHNALLEWCAHADPARIFLVHGEPEAQEALGRSLDGGGANVMIPERGDEVEIK